MKIDSLNSMGYGGPEFHPLPKADEGQVLSVNQAAPSVQSSFSHLLEKSLQLTSDSAGAIAEARRALESGDLDKPEAIRDAAAKIVRQGI